MAPPRYNAGALLDGAAIRASAERSPRLRSFVKTIAGASERGEPRARGLLEYMIRRLVTDVGELHLTNAMERLGKIQTLRDNIAAILDHVLDEGQLPPEVRPERLGEYFDQLSSEMRELSKPKQAIVGDEPLKIYDNAEDYARGILRDFEAGKAEPAPGGVHVEPSAEVAAAFRGMPAGRQAALRRATALAPEMVWRVVSAETESGAAKALAQLKGELGGLLSEAEWAEVRTGLGELGKARNSALQMNPARLAEALARIADPQLRAVVQASGDVWILQQVAAHNPEALATVWESFLAKGGSPTDHAGFRAHLRDYMVHWGRSGTAEYTAAFSLSGIEAFLKGPDHSPQVGGIDLIGLGNDGWGWLIDDKSHRATRVSGVSAFEGDLAGNLFDDARAFEDAMERLRGDDPGFVPDPRVLDVIQRMREAALDIERIQRTGRPAGRPGRIATALADRKLRLRVTSAMGEVVDVSKALADIGVEVEPTGINVPLPRPGGK